MDGIYRKDPKKAAIIIPIITPPKLIDPIELNKPIYKPNIT